MAFDITDGSIGLLGALFIGCAIIVVLCMIIFFVGATREAREDVLESHDADRDVD